MVLFEGEKSHSQDESIAIRWEKKKFFSRPFHTFPIIIIIIRFSRGQFMSVINFEAVQSRCFNFRITFHTDDDVEIRNGEKGKKKRSSGRQTRNGKNYRQIKIFSIGSRSQIKKFNIFRYPFYTFFFMNCCCREMGKRGERKEIFRLVFSPFKHRHFLGKSMTKCLFCAVRICCSFSA